MSNDWIKTSAPDRYLLLKGFAKKNRQAMTLAESVMWEHLRTIEGFHFRRQHPIGDYIADFICLKKQLVIEIDGGYHAAPGQQYNDGVRTEDLQRLGFTVIRFTNEAILHDIQTVMQEIIEILLTVK